MPNRTPEQLVFAYGDMVYRLAYAQTRSKSDADDIFQEVFLRVVRSTPPFTGKEHEKAWLIRVTLNCLKSHWRSAWRRHDAPLDDRLPFPAPEDGILDDALRQLPPKYRAVIHLFYYEGYTAEEIARMMGEKPSTVRTRLTRARAKLRELLKGEWEDGPAKPLPQTE